MAIARASPGAKLVSSGFIALRRLYSTTASIPRPPSKGSPPPKGRPHGGAAGNRPPGGGPRNAQPNKKPKPTPMYIPPEARKFITRTHLNTTPENWAFLNETGIEYDNSKVTRLHLGPENSRINADFTTRVMFSPRHIMHPYHLHYLTPRQHPLTEKIKAEYREKVKKEPLWTIFISQNGQPGLVRGIGHRRLKAAFWTALERLGYKSLPGEGEPCIKGTVMVLISDTLKAANHPAHRFGEAAAAAVVKEWKRLEKAGGQPDGENPGFNRARRPTI